MITKENRFFIFLLLISAFALLSFSQITPKNTNFSERAKIILREVGNQLLLSNKDSTSIILPVAEIDEHTFKISFENELSLKPNILVSIVKQSFEKTVFSKNYIVQVFRCYDNEVAYSYEINKLEEKTIIPCAGRVLPKACYTIEVKFVKNRSWFSKYSYLFYIFIPLVLGIFYRVFYLNNKPQNITETNDEKIISLGSFQFYPSQNKLIKKSSEISLSKKECELLAIFVTNKNQIVKREELTKKVWEDNGVFVGRSLDTYISKLRKKLKDDASIQLINVHGVGYKLEINS